MSPMPLLAFLSSAGLSPRRRGMTLLEITVAVTVIAVMIAVVVPNFGPARLKGQLRTSARNLAAMIRYARGEAIYGRHLVKLRMDVRNGAYRFDRMTDGKPASEREPDAIEPVEMIRRLHEKVYFDRVVLYEGADKVRNDIVVLEFTPRGTCTPATIVLTDAKGKKMTIDVFGITGAVEVYAGEPPE